MAESLISSLELVKELLEDGSISEQEKKVVKKLMLYVDLSVKDNCNHSEKIVTDAVDKIKIQIAENNDKRGKTLNNIFEKLRGIELTITDLVKNTAENTTQIMRIKKIAGINGGS